MERNDEIWTVRERWEGMDRSLSFWRGVRHSVWISTSQGHEEMRRTKARWYTVFKCCKFNEWDTVFAVSHVLTTRDGYVCWNGSSLSLMKCNLIITVILVGFLTQVVSWYKKQGIPFLHFCVGFSLSLLSQIVSESQLSFWSLLWIVVTHRLKSFLQEWDSLLLLQSLNLQPHQK